MAEHVIKCTTTGSAGSALVTATSEDIIEGLLIGVFVDYHASAPATTVVVVSEVGGTAQTLLSLAASATDVKKYPMALLHDTSGVSIGTYGRIYIPRRKVQVAVTLSDALTNAVVVTLLVV